MATVESVARTNGVTGSESPQRDISIKSTPEPNNDFRVNEAGDELGIPSESPVGDLNSLSSLLSNNEEETVSTCI